MPKASFLVLHTGPLITCSEALKHNFNAVRRFQQSGSGQSEDYTAGISILSNKKTRSDSYRRVSQKKSGGNGPFLFEKLQNGMVCQMRDMFLGSISRLSLK